MYDTINMWLDRGDIPNIDLLGKVPQHLTEIHSESFNKRTEQYYISGKLGNYKISVSDNGISFRGSLAKFYLGDNLQILTRQDTQRAIEQMSEVIELPIKKARINRIDLGFNFITKYPPEAYYQYLGATQYYQRLKQPNSIYYQNNQRQLIFYNKILEATKKGVLIPPIYQNNNVLRYELRLMKGLSKQLKEKVTAQRLYNEEFYIKVLDKWYSNYQAVNKIHIPYLNYEAMKSPKDYIYRLTLIGLSTLGLNQALEEVETLRKLKTFKQAEYYSRLKRDLRKLANNPKHTSNSVHIEELDKKVKRAVKFYR